MLYPEQKIKGKVLTQTIRSLRERLVFPLAKGPMLAGLLFFIVVIIWFWTFSLLPTVNVIRTLERDKTMWQSILREGSAPSIVLPTMTELPNILSSCRQSFLDHEVNVKTLNLEKLDSSQQGQNGLNSAMVRLFVEGSWQGIKAGINELEENPHVAIHVREVNLAEEQGEVLIQIFFRDID